MLHLMNPIKHTISYYTKFRRVNYNQSLGSCIHADNIMDLIVHNTVWFETGSLNIHEV